jgi:hypothetical protein
MRRQGGGAVAVGPVAILRIAVDAFGEKAFQPRPRYRLARRPGLAQAFRQKQITGPPLLDAACSAG